MSDDGWAEAWREFTALDSAAAERVREKLAQRAAVVAPAPPERTGSAAASAPPGPVVTADSRSADRQPLYVRLANTFTHLGVRVGNGEVYPYPALGRSALGLVQGARAEITDPTKAQMVRAGLASGLALGPLIEPFALAPALLRKSKAIAFVVCANGHVHEHKLDGTSAIRAAQREAARFNALAGPELPPAPLSPPPAIGTPADRLVEVARLHDHGLLNDEEYKAKRAEIISQL